MLTGSQQQMLAMECAFGHSSSVMFTVRTSKSLWQYSPSTGAICSKTSHVLHQFRLTLIDFDGCGRVVREDYDDAVSDIRVPDKRRHIVCYVNKFRGFRCDVG
jgi:hypothetical protein